MYHRKPYIDVRDDGERQKAIATGRSVILKDTHFEIILHRLNQRKKLINITSMLQILIAINI